MKCTRLGFLKSLCAIPVGVGLAKASQAQQATPPVKVVEVKRFSGAETPRTPSSAELEAVMQRAAEAFDPFLAREFINKRRFWPEITDPYPLRFKLKA